MWHAHGGAFQRRRVGAPSAAVPAPPCEGEARRAQEATREPSPRNAHTRQPHNATPPHPSTPVNRTQVPTPPIVHTGARREHGARAHDAPLLPPHQPGPDSRGLQYDARPSPLIDNNHLADAECSEALTSTRSQSGRSPVLDHNLQYSITISEITSTRSRSRRSPVLDHDLGDYQYSITISEITSTRSQSRRLPVLDHNLGDAPVAPWQVDDETLE